MVEFYRILVPVDFSEPSGHAARYAADLSRHFVGEVTLLHVVPEATFGYSMIEPTAEVRGEISAEHRIKAAARLAEFAEGIGVVKPVMEVAEGDPAEEITRLADSGRFDAVVISTRGAGRIARLLTIGSVTSKILDAADCPVITGQHFENHYAPLSIKRIVCAIDLGPQSKRVLCWAAQYAARFGAEVVVAHAAPLGEAHREMMDDSLREILADRLKKRMESLQEQIGLRAETRLEFDDVPRAIAGLARRLRADAIVVGRGVSQDLIGRLRANAYDIIRQSHCPVVSV